MPMLVMLKEHQLATGETVMVPDRYVRASDFDDQLGQANNPEWKTVAFDEAGKVVLPHGAIGFRWGPDGRADQGSGTWRPRKRSHGHDVKLRLSLLEGDTPSNDTAQGRLPVFRRHRSAHFPNNAQSDVLVRTVPVQRIALGKAGEKREALVATVFDLQAANYGVARGLRRRAGRDELRRRHALHAGLAGTHHRHAARPGHHGGARVRRQRATRRRAGRW